MVFSTGVELELRVNSQLNPPHPPHPSFSETLNSQHVGCSQCWRENPWHRAGRQTAVVGTRNWPEQGDAKKSIGREVDTHTPPSCLIQLQRQLLPALYLRFCNNAVPINSLDRWNCPPPSPPTHMHTVELSSAIQNTAYKQLGKSNNCSSLVHARLLPAFHLGFCSNNANTAGTPPPPNTHTASSSHTSSWVQQ